MTPSCPVTIALGIRKARKPRIHQPKAVGPALWITAALVMNRTMAAKIATMSNELRTFGRIPPATRSESSSPLAAGSTAAMVVPPPARGGGYQGGGGRGCWTCPNRSPKAGQRLELCPVVEALEGHVLLGERARLGPLHRQVGGAPQRPERVHEQLVPLRRAQRVGQAPDPAPPPRRSAQVRRVHVGGRSRVELVADPVQPCVDVATQREVGVGRRVGGLEL